MLAHTLAYPPCGTRCSQPSPSSWLAAPRPTSRPAAGLRVPHCCYTTVMQDLVRKTLDYLQPCLQEDVGDPDFAASIAWPAFIAGCEATCPDTQQRALQSIKSIEASTMIFSSEPASQVVTTIWEHRSRTGDLRYSWPDVMMPHVLMRSSNVFQSGCAAMSAREIKEITLSSTQHAACLHQCCKSMQTQAVNHCRLQA